MWAGVGSIVWARSWLIFPWNRRVLNENGPHSGLAPGVCVGVGWGRTIPSRVRMCLHQNKAVAVNSA